MSCCFSDRIIFHISPTSELQWNSAIWDIFLTRKTWKNTWKTPVNKIADVTRDCCSWPTPISWRPFDGRVLPSHWGSSHCFPARWLSPAARGNFVGVASYSPSPNRLYSIFHSVVLRWCRFNDFLAQLWDLHFRINLGEDGMVKQWNLWFCFVLSFFDDSKTAMLPSTWLFSPWRLGPVEAGVAALRVAWTPVTTELRKWKIAS